MRFTEVADILRLVENAVPEGPSLEFKESLPLKTRKERLELLKDLTGMANGGGGSLIFGLRESDAEPAVAAELAPLDDAHIIGVVEDIVRSGVRPPLLIELTTIDVSGGAFCFAADVEPSPVGPYMVEAYGEQRYYTRIGTRTAPMTEQHVRDAYILAARLRDRRPIVWEDHHLPIELPSSEHPWVAIAAVPEEPLREIIDVGAIEPEALRPPSPIDRYLNITGLDRAVSHLGRWADGYFGNNRYGEERPPTVIARLHRDGSVGIADQLHRALSAILAARVLNAQLLYVAWLWKRFDLRRPVELHARLEGLDGAALDIGSMFGETRVVHEPTGVKIDRLVQSEHLLPRDLLAASRRHRVAQRFADRIHQAYGLARALPLFRSGQLYGQDGRPIGLSVAGGGAWNAEGRQVGWAREDGFVLDQADGVLAHWAEGVLLDLDGDVFGVLELAPGAACPDDFLVSAMLTDPRARVPGGNPGAPLAASDCAATPPAPTRRWSSRSIAEVFTEPEGS